mmetsp:Transcript_18360/g.51177  ORF Transcript_18360/g.51177 Transcript_18360/m.51177 type:complete len:419 (-) Transcript_18360:1627-2883(-)
MMQRLHTLSAALIWMAYAGSIRVVSSSVATKTTSEGSETTGATTHDRLLEYLPQRRPRIHGGWDAIEDRYSYAQVSLQWDDEGHQCGASLVAPDMVLTAAHCIGSFNKIEIGKFRKFDGTDVSEMFESVLEIKHPDYDEVTTRYDVMVVKLNGRTTLATPIRINRDETLLEDGNMLTVIGMGYNGDWELPDAVQETLVEYNINSECEEIVDEHGITLDGDLYDDMMCAGSDGRDSCYGDSGSPLVFTGANEGEDVQVGLVSWGYECAGTLPGVYCRLSHWPVYEFIERNVCLHSAEPPDHFNCALWTPIPTKTPTIAPSAAPTETPSAAPSVSQEPTQSMQPTISGAPTNIETQSPTSERLRQFLEGAANIPIQSRVSNSTVSELWESEASGAFGTGPSFCASVASVVLFCATWACLL